MNRSLGVKTKPYLYCNNHYICNDGDDDVAINYTKMYSVHALQLVRMEAAEV